MLVKFDHQILARYPKSMLNNLNNVLAISSSIITLSALRSCFLYSYGPLNYPVTTQWEISWGIDFHQQQGCSRCSQLQVTLDLMFLIVQTDAEAWLHVLHCSYFVIFCLFFYYIRSFFFTAGCGFFLLVPGSMLSCFSAFLLLCFSASLLFFSCFLLFFLLCFSCFSASLLYLVFFVSASLLSLLLCFSAFVLLRLSTLLFYIFFSSVMCFGCSTSCSSASLLPIFTASWFFSFILLYSLLFVS